MLQMLEKGRVVKSIAGHDQNRFYAILESSAGKILIADGKERKLAKPKRKNARHLRPTRSLLDMEAITTDKRLRDALAAFNRAGAEQEGGIELV